MKVGILGTGGMGGRHATHAKKIAGVELGAFDPDAERLAFFASEKGVTPFESARELIEWAEVVDVCTPTDRHADLALESLKSGKPTLLEKPLARSLAECEELLKVAKQTKMPLGTAQVVRFFPDYSAAHKAIKSGKIGTPAAIRMRRGGGMPTGWFGDMERSGGVLLDLAVHEFDWLIWTLGQCTQVYSRSIQFGDSRGSHESRADYSLTTLTFANGAVAHVEATWMDPGGGRSTLEAAGSGGVIEFDSRLNNALRISTVNGSRAESPNPASDDPYFRQISAFLEAIRNGRPVPVTGRDGANATALALAALESASTGQPVTPKFFGPEFDYWAD